MKYICSVCNREFESKHKTLVCPECKTGTCIVCGKKFEQKFPYTAKTCSAKCRGIYRKESGIAAKVASKAKDTLKMRYGVTNAVNVSKPSDMKRCPICGELFLPDTFRQIYCKNRHYGPCPVCGKMTEIKELNVGPQCCSEECRSKQIEQTCLDRYGVTNASKLESSKEKAKQTCLDRYGKEYYAQTDEYNKRYRQTCLDRYGKEYPLQNAEIRQKQISTNRQKYGSDSPLENKQIQQKAQQTMERKYGGTGLGSEELSEKIRNTMKDRYGHEYPSQVEEFKAKATATSIKNNGVPNFKQSKKGIINNVKDPSKLSNYMEFKSDPRTYIATHYTTAPTVRILEQDLGVTDTPIYECLIKHDCCNLIESAKISTMEYELIDFLNSIGVNNIRHNCKYIINPLELDIYLPDYNFAIECDPTVTHNSSFADPWGQPPKNPSYHKTKSERCSEVGVELLHIFGYDWTANKEIIKSMIASRLGKIDLKFYARECNIVELTDAECKEFLTNNHQKGAGSFPIRLGLVTKRGNLLVSVMTFNKMRKTIGIQDDSYELSRFCNLLNTTVVGGASKLFKHFISSYPEVTSVVSYSDIAHTSGKLYQKLGFIEETHSDPNYVWVNLSTDEAVNRVNAQKSNLKRFLKDDSIDLSKTERAIMTEHGYCQVFDSGTIRWRWTKQKA